MEIDVISLPPHSKEILDPRIKSFKKDLSKINGSFDILKTKLNESMIFGEKFDIEANELSMQQNDHRMRQISKNNRKLQDAISVGYETENTAKDIKLGLHNNSDKLRRANDNVHRINGQLTLSNRLIDIMQAHENKNKLIIYCVGLVIIIAVLIVGYWALFK